MKNRFRVGGILAGVCLLTGCLSADRHRARLDERGTSAIEGVREELGVETEYALRSGPAPFRERALELREELGPTPGVYDAFLELTNDQSKVLSLMDALQVAADTSREFRQRKEQVFTRALALERQEDAFRTSYAGMMDSVFSTDGGGEETVSGIESGGELGITKRFASGAQLGSRFAVDLAKLLTLDEDSALGLLGELTFSIPLLRGAGRETVTEPLVQARRDLVYDVYNFERFKRTFAVSVANDYLNVLQQIDGIANAAENYRGLIGAARRSSRMAEAGRLSEIAVDQARQDELRARERWINSVLGYLQQLDGFKDSLGIPPDVRVKLDYSDLDRLLGSIADDAPEEVEEAETVDADAPIELVVPSREMAGDYELEEAEATRLALSNRLDLVVAEQQVEDAERRLRIARRELQPELDLTGSASVGEGRSLGSADQDDAKLDFGDGRASVGLAFDFPWERTDEAIAFRLAMLSLEQAIRDLEQLTDGIRRDVRNRLRELAQARESKAIQALSVQLARRRVESTRLFLEAGRTQIRDVLEAQEALISAQNALTSARVRYRVAELELQRDMGLLSVTDDGIWNEFTPQPK